MKEELRQNWERALNHACWHWKMADQSRTVLESFDHMRACYMWLSEALNQCNLLEMHKRFWRG